MNVGEPLKAALPLNYDPNGPSRFLSIVLAIPQCQSVHLYYCFFPNDIEIISLLKMFNIWYERGFSSSDKIERLPNFLTTNAQHFVCNLVH